MILSVDLDFLDAVADFYGGVGMNRDGYVVDRPAGYYSAVFGGDLSLLPVRDDDTAVAGESVILSAFSSSLFLAVAKEIYQSVPFAHQVMKTVSFASSHPFSHHSSTTDVLASLLLDLVVVEQREANTPSWVTF